jgi:hypothetical protein
MSDAPPIRLLWVLEKGYEMRIAALYAHPGGFEIRVLNRAAEIIGAELVESSNEADAMQTAATLKGEYRANGWRPVKG